jgi:hypothetical protein
MGVSWTLNIPTLHCIDEERDDESFMRVDIVSRDQTLLHCFQNMSELVTRSW